MEGEFQTELNRVAPETNPQGDTWVPGHAPRNPCSGRRSP